VVARVLLGMLRDLKVVEEEELVRLVRRVSIVAKVSFLF